MVMGLSIMFWLTFMLHTKVLIPEATYLFTYLLTYILTYSIEQSPPGEANNSSASQEFPHISTISPYIESG